MTPSPRQEQIDSLTSNGEALYTHRYFAHSSGASPAVPRGYSRRLQTPVVLAYRLDPLPGKASFFVDAQGQWDVVGDTFPIGYAFNKGIIYPDNL